MSDLVAFLRARLDDDGGDNRVHDLDCNLSLSAGYHGPCDCGWDDRMRREVEAKRRILDAHLAYYGDGPDEWWPVPALRLLALPYDQHPDYRPEWAVTP